MRRDIAISELIPAPVERVWQALTDPAGDVGAHRGGWRKIRRRLPVHLAVRA